MKSILNLIEKNWFFITLTLLVVISTLSLLPLAHLPTMPGTDKTHHFIAYLLLALPIALKKQKYWILLILLLVAWSGVIELIQPSVNRYGEWLDLLANTSGLVIGVMVGFFGRKFLLKN